MSREAEVLWERALEALRAAEAVLPVSADAAASRAYYAAFYAASALFALEGKTFRKHSTLEAAVHRDLVRPGRWPRAIAADYSKLFNLRQRGDYGVEEHASAQEALQAIAAAKEILAAVSHERPDCFGSME